MLWITPIINRILSTVILRPKSGVDLRVVATSRSFLPPEGITFNSQKKDQNREKNMGKMLNSRRISWKKWPEEEGDGARILDPRQFVYISVSYGRIWDELYFHFRMHESHCFLLNIWKKVFWLKSPNFLFQAIYCFADENEHTWFEGQHFDFRTDRFRSCFRILHYAATWPLQQYFWTQWCHFWFEWSHRPWINQSDIPKSSQRFDKHRSQIHISGKTEIITFFVKLYNLRGGCFFWMNCEK